jgi:hypothetical protein
MLSSKQKKFRDSFLSPLRQKIYFIKNLPMGLISGIKLIGLDESISITEVPYRWLNKNPFRSMYFAVQSMAAELSTAAMIIMALKGIDRNAALIITGVKAEFVKKAKSRIIFSCRDYEIVCDAMRKLRVPGDEVSIEVKSEGRDADDEIVATFVFTWSFKAR